MTQNILSQPQGKSALLLSKVPEVTLYFWIIKILCTTVGETASDYLNVNLGWGLTATSIVIGIVLAVFLALQVKSKRYVPGLYWFAVFLISIFGTLVTDNLTDALGIPLETSTIVFSALLLATFLLWYASEKTLSITSITTRRRELLYWLAILFTFALGTAAGDLMAESLGLGYLVTGIIVLVAIVAVTVSWRLGLDAVLGFWIAYILTRPLGASIGDYLSQPLTSGGLGLGAAITSGIFVAAIIGTVTFLAITKKDSPKPVQAVSQRKGPSAAWQTAIVLIIVLTLSLTGYSIRQQSLQAAAPATETDRPLGDLSEFRTITVDTLALVMTGKPAEAKTRITDLESAWDDAQATLKPLNKDVWNQLDDDIDAALRKVRASKPDAAASEQAIQTLLSDIDKLDPPAAS